MKNSISLELYNFSLAILLRMFLFPFKDLFWFFCSLHKPPIEETLFHLLLALFSNGHFVKFVFFGFHCDKFKQKRTEKPSFPTFCHQVISAHWAVYGRARDHHISAYFGDLPSFSITPPNPWVKRWTPFLYLGVQKQVELTYAEKLNL